MGIFRLENNRRCLVGLCVLMLAILVGAQTDLQPAQAQTARPPDQDPNATPEALDVRIRGLLTSPEAQRAHWGVLVADMHSGKTLYDLNGGQFFTPASTTKLFTTALALAKLGPDYRFRTTLETNGKLDGQGVLHGDLFLVGRGSPDLSNRLFPYDPHVAREGQPEKGLAELANALLAQGVKRIEGNIVADDSAFANEPYPPGWEIEDVKYAYGTAISAIAVNDNVFFAEVVPGSRAGALARIKLEPPLADLYVQNAIRTVSRHGETKMRIEWQPGAQTVRLEGTIALGEIAQNFTLANPEPAEYAARLLRYLLQQRGVKVLGRIRVLHAPQPTPQPREVLVEHLSPPLREIVAVMNKNSENLFAELLLRAVALQATREGSREAGLQVEMDFLESAGVPEGTVLLQDGCGLARGDLVTPSALVALLQFAAVQPWGRVFRASLPIAGEDGTLAFHMKDVAAAGRVEAKTGTLQSAKALAGYATTVSGRAVVFALLASQLTMTPHDAGATLDDICEAIIEGIPAASGEPCAACPK